MGLALAEPPVGLGKAGSENTAVAKSVPLSDPLTSAGCARLRIWQIPGPAPASSSPVIPLTAPLRAEVASRTTMRNFSHSNCFCRSTGWLYRINLSDELKKFPLETWVSRRDCGHQLGI